MIYEQRQGEPGEALERLAASQWIDLGHGVRLQLEQCEDGWRWRAWEQMTRCGWRPLPTPAAQDVTLRFGTRARAEIFFQRLALLLLPHGWQGER